MQENAQKNLNEKLRANFLPLHLATPLQKIARFDDAFWDVFGW